MTARCVGCGLHWNISIYQQIPRTGYTCPHCDSQIRTGQTTRDTRADQDRRPQKPKGAQT